MEGALSVTLGSLGPSLPLPCACRLALDLGEEAVRQELERLGLSQVTSRLELCDLGC